jgi:putative membrane protein insertion efficiency factor
MTAPELVRHAGAPARWALLGAIRFYSRFLSGWLGGQCRFAPTCSHYADVAIRRHGAVRGTMMAVWRVGRCNPYGRGGFDPVPPARRPEPERYDSGIQAEEARA